MQQKWRSYRIVPASNANISDINFLCKMKDFLVRYYWVNNRYNAIVMELLGPSVDELHRRANRKFTIITVTKIAIQIINRLEVLHSKGYIHRDIKPENFLIGLKPSEDTIYLIDFGLAKEYRHLRSPELAHSKGKHGIVGTLRFISVNVHEGAEPSRRDDLISLGYMLSFLFHGSLPWQIPEKISFDERCKKIYQCKKKITISELFNGMPSEFSSYFESVSKLGFDEDPDYEKLKEPFETWLSHVPLKSQIFDWMPKTQKSEQSSFQPAVFSNASPTLPTMRKKSGQCPSDNAECSNSSNDTSIAAVNEPKPTSPAPLYSNLESPAIPSRPSRTQPAHNGNLKSDENKKSTDQPRYFDVPLLRSSPNPAESGCVVQVAQSQAENQMTAHPTSQSPSPLSPSSPLSSPPDSTQPHEVGYSEASPLSSEQTSPGRCTSPPISHPSDSSKAISTMSREDVDASVPPSECSQPQTPVHSVESSYDSSFLESDVSFAVTDQYLRTESNNSRFMGSEEQTMVRVSDGSITDSQSSMFDTKDSFDSSASARQQSSDEKGTVVFNSTSADTSSQSTSSSAGQKMVNDSLLSSSASIGSINQIDSPSLHPMTPNANTSQPSPSISCHHTAADRDAAKPKEQAKKMFSGFVIPGKAKPFDVRSAFRSAKMPSRAFKPDFAAEKQHDTSSNNVEGASSDASQKENALNMSNENTSAESEMKEKTKSDEAKVESKVKGISHTQNFNLFGIKACSHFAVTPTTKEVKDSPTPKPKTEIKQSFYTSSRLVFPKMNVTSSFSLKMPNMLSKKSAVKKSDSLPTSPPPSPSSAKQPSCSSELPFKASVPFLSMYSKVSLKNTNSVNDNLDDQQRESMIVNYSLLSIEDS
ncbi:putative Casein kinase I [Monocercomonoides exilis]|uniref:putative Casein kinase I n=1 Tax=Monocercomonoides exilis TaxID=2049356 RepID=UPI003559A304|nr:putative Casein kinase I [Monocercomonoides exilis]|eukprot:MONOS_171.1-p1 / transcript=MONOS_171.1 / gene=MONOS_171 / organism=Monocercomonoides_exilis_PA203 / gene_product=Casein kinase I isoform delta-like protein / transcript_product=Casein kinase I isoform delta-like protein / location=Mono_scaffold00003:102453-105483(+) / protein_length=872 / sequence_SO=supercontig / SO=protein_coding / is_pseudo=false